MRVNVYDTFEDEVETMKLAERLQSEGMESLKQPHLWSTEPIKAMKSTILMTRQVLETF